MSNFKLDDEAGSNKLLLEDRYPHLRNHILSFNEGITNSLSIKVDSEAQCYLKDHVFGGESFIPATMIIEILFEAVMYYCEYYLDIDVINLKPAQLKNFSILRALKMKPGDSIEADIEFGNCIKSEDEVCMDIKIVSKRINNNNNVIGKRINVTSEVILTKTPHEPIKFEIPNEHYNYYEIPKGQFYKDYFPSLGPLFQTSCARFAVNDSRTHYIAEYDCNDNEEKFIKGQKSKFLTSPLGNDSCLQAAVFFSRMINLIGRLPIGGEELYFYKEHPTSGKVCVYVEKVDIDNDMKCNIYSYDSTGVIFYAKNFIVRKSPYHKLMDREIFEKNIGDHKIDSFEL